jgi:hypothetical protein
VAVLTGGGTWQRAHACPVTLKAARPSWQRMQAGLPGAGIASSRSDASAPVWQPRQETGRPGAPGSVACGA